MDMLHVAGPVSNRHHLAILIMTAVLVAGACGRGEAGRQDHVRRGTAVPDTFKFAGLEEIRDYFAANKFTLETWQSGDRSVPRLYLASVPSRWRHEVAPSLPVDLKKRYFFFVYAPLVLEANENILADRERLHELADKNGRSEDENRWLQELAERYFLEGELDADLLSELTHRVDAVPPSLALSQAAVESGWSTSRFADMGNALFGQWTWSGDGITPTEQRDKLGDYKIKAFDSPEQSIAAYMHNLNTHRSYEGFRKERAKARKQGKELDGNDLAGTLTSYSEKGEEYVETLRSVIRVNKLKPTDACYLRDMTPVLLVPVGKGSD
jgi:uncharacterized FlgJ-related protein